MSPAEFGYSDVRDTSFLLGILVLCLYVEVLVGTLRELRGNITLEERRGLCRRVHIVLFIILISGSTMMFNGLVMIYGWMKWGRVPEYHVVFQLGHWMRVAGLALMLRLATYERIGEWFWFAVTGAAVSVALFV